MNLTINQAQSRNYTNKYLKDNRNEKINLDIELADKKITEEEDKKDYETYTKVICLIQLTLLKMLKKTEYHFLRQQLLE
ncbi:hypothetical protein LL033_24870 (plasmid) [Clostridium estertheticum]|uniref:hypothetical protein n=1 Tax=Clostridium estertheticum TaxID=238834 RepID=UPI001C0CB031|nr:hypothetical protein [Clostridium estertheticum]MBU3217840.1 hypothetical protein [Clostridium estertheticum]WAG58358.1 hypothetical protein LL033_24870 [Clostridium estertheticum]